MAQIRDEEFRKLYERATGKNLPAKVQERGKELIQLQKEVAQKANTPSAPSVSSTVPAVPMAARERKALPSLASLTQNRTKTTRDRRTLPQVERPSLLDRVRNFFNPSGSRAASLADEASQVRERFNAPRQTEPPEDLRNPLRSSAFSQAPMPGQTAPPLFSRTGDVIKNINDEMARIQEQYDAAIAAGAREMTWGDIPRSFIRGIENVNTGNAAFREMQGLPNNLPQVYDRLSSDKYNFATKNFLLESLGGGAEQLGQQLRMAADPSTVTLAATGAIGGAAAGSPVLGVGAIPGMIAGAGSGLIAGMANQTLRMEAGLSYLEMVNAGVDKDVASKAAFLVGGVNAAIEFAEIGQLVKGYKALLKNPETRNLGIRLATKLLDLGVNVTKETGQEVLQEGVAIAGENIAKGMSGLPTDTEQDIRNRLFDTARSSALAFGAMMAPSAVVGSFNNAPPSIDDGLQPWQRAAQRGMEQRIEQREDQRLADEAMNNARQAMAQQTRAQQARSMVQRVADNQQQRGLSDWLSGRDVYTPRGQRSEFNVTDEGPAPKVPDPLPVPEPTPTPLPKPEELRPAEPEPVSPPLPEPAPAHEPIAPQEPKESAPVAAKTPEPIKQATQEKTPVKTPETASTAKESKQEEPSSTEEPKYPFSKGDTVKLDGRTYRITGIGRWDVNLDPVSIPPGVLPIGRVENIGKIVRAIEQQKSETQETVDTPQQKLANGVRRFLDASGDDQKMNTARLTELADEAFGGTMGEGKYTIKDAYDGMELAVNQHLMEQDWIKKANGDTKTAKQVAERLQKLLDKLPTQRNRTDEQQSFQQFSTPPPIAYLAAWAANVNQNDVVMEPSAGIGGLALWPKAWGAKVYGNELSERRLAFLNHLGLDGTFNLNAEQIDNLLPDDVKPSVVIMNPPFSSTAGRTATNKTSNAERHIEQALERLEPGGRLVAILGKGMADDAPAFRKWWDKIKGEYDLKANISIDGKNYTKYGTSWGVQLVVIDKDGPTQKAPVTVSVKDLGELPGILEGIRNDRPEKGSQGAGRDQQNASVATVQEPSPRKTAGEERRGTVDRGGDSVSPAREPGGSTVSEPAADSNPDATQPVSGNDRADGRDTAGLPAEDGVSVSDDEPGGPGEQRDGRSAGVDETGDREGEGDGGPSLETPGPGRNEPAKQRLQSDGRLRLTKEEIENENLVYARYQPDLGAAKPTDGKPHPAPLVESAAMAAVSHPKIIYKPHLPAEMIKSGRPSLEQLENIALAGQAHQQKLPNGSRKGFFIGDGTGVGKGIQIASIIRDNFNQGRDKAIWISENADLIKDAERDWTDVGGDKKDLIDFSKVKLNKGIPEDQKGILFTAYSTLGSQKKAERLKILKDWLGEDFDGVIAFDEAHNMGNSGGKKAKFGKQKPAAKALAGIELQKTFPNARVVYASATGATELSEYQYLDRLGLWGPGTAFRDSKDFIERIGQGGLAALELVARDMKAAGVYNARSISYDDVTYETVEHELNPAQERIYDTLSDAWRLTLQRFNEALEATGANKNGRARGAAYSAFWGALQRFYNQVLTSMAMPTVVESVKKDLADGKSVVLQIVNTNEAQEQRAIADTREKGLDLEDMDLTPSQMLIEMVRKSFPVIAQEEYTDDYGNLRMRDVEDADGNKVEDKKAVRMREALIGELQDMRVPDGPLQILFDTFGVENVAEVTGRKERVVYKPDKDGQMKRTIEKRNDKSSNADIDAFQRGDKRILVFSTAGSTGRSYHADRRAENQQQRVHYLLQPGWNAKTATQGFGRTHRSNQVSAPIFRLVTTNVSGQKRFTSTIARRLDQLGALTKGQRQTGSGVFSAKDNLENSIAESALRTFLKRKPKEFIEEMGLKIYDQNGYINESADDLTNVSRFLNRLLALPVERQNEEFEEFYSILDDMTETAIANGTLDQGLENYRADKIELVNDDIVSSTKDGAETRYVELKAFNKPKPKTLKQMENAHKNFLGLYRVKETGGVFAAYQLRSTDSNGNVTDKVLLENPTRKKLHSWTRKNFDEKTEAIPQKEWKATWDQAIKDLPKYEETTLHMLTGSLLPVWDKLPQEGVRVVRVVTNKGDTLLGRIIPPREIKNVLRNLGYKGEAAGKTYTTDQVLDGVLKDNKVAVFDRSKLPAYIGALRLVRKRVNGENRIEVVGNNAWQLASAFRGLITETIDYRRRIFVPTGENGKTVLGEILQRYPVDEIRDNDDGDMMNSIEPTGVSARWTAERIKDGKAKLLPIDQLVSRIEHDFKVKITTGKTKNKDSRGQYNPNTGGIRTRIANLLPTIAHELGHRLHEVYDLRRMLSDEMKQELVNNMEPAFREQYPETRWTAEGIAEFLRYFLQNREISTSRYPIFTPFFLEVLSDADRKNIIELADEINAYYALSGEDAKINLAAMNEKGKDFRTWKEKIEDFGKGIAKLANSNAPLRWLSDAYGDDDRRLYKLATNSAYSQEVAAAALQGDKIRDLNGEVIGDSFLAGLRNAGVNINDPEEYADFNEYLTLRHAIEVLQKGKQVFAEPYKNSTTYCLSRMQALLEKRPNFEKGAQAVYKFQGDIMQVWGIGTGLVNKELYTEIRKAEPFYVPFQRYMGDEEPTKGRRGKRGFVNQNSPIKRMKGSGRRIINPLDNIIMQTHQIVAAGYKNLVGATMAKYEADPNWKDSALYLEKADPKKVPYMASVSNMAEMLKHNATALVEAGLIGEDFVSEMDAVLEASAKLILQFGKGIPTGDNLVTVMQNGKPVWYQINDPELLNSLLQMNYQTSNAILRVIGKTTRFMSMNATGNNIVWGLRSNAFRDFLTTLFFNKVSKNPVKNLWGIAKFWMDSFGAELNDSAYIDEFKSMGGAKTSVYTIDQDIAAKTRKDMKRGWKRWMNPYEVLSFLMANIESGPRAAYYVMCRKAGMDPSTAFYEAMDLTVNFRNGSPTTKSIGYIFPFFSAGVNGMDKFVRWISADDVPPRHKERKRKVIRSRTIGLISVSLAAAGAMIVLNSSSDDRKKYYSMLGTYVKNNYWCIPIDDEGHFFCLPKPRELAALSSFFEALFAAYIMDDPHALDDFGEYLAEQTLPPGLAELSVGDWKQAIGNAGLVGVMASIGFNVDFAGRPIVSSAFTGYNKVEAKDQYTANTSKLAKAIGGAFNISPQQIDYFGGQVLGGWWKGQQSLFPVGAEDRTAMERITGYLSMEKDALYSTQLVNRMYEYRDKAETKKNSSGKVSDAIDHKQADAMATFYGRYYRLAKNEPETDRNREVREQVLDMVNIFMQGVENGITSNTEKKLRKMNDPSLYPTARGTTIKDSDKREHKLTAAQYFDYQLTYNSIYWNYVGDALNEAGSNKTAVKKAQDLAEKDAKASMLKKLGYSDKLIDDRQARQDAGLSAGEYADFYKNLEKADDPDTKQQEEVIKVLREMKLSQAEKEYLWQKMGYKLPVKN